MNFSDKVSIGSFYEFFAGGGMARAGLGANWRCLLANDFDHKKYHSYVTNWGDSEIRLGDVRAVTTADLPDQANLVWASFPCQDLSLAGGGAGLKGERSGTFWPFWELIQSLVEENRAPEIIVLENVCGTLTSHNGEDFTAICNALQKEGYKFGALVVDAALFVPQSRPRLFFIALREDLDIPDHLNGCEPQARWHTRTLQTVFKKLCSKTKKNWIWWRMPMPQERSIQFSDLIEENPDSTTWHTQAETRQLLSMMSDINLEKVREAKRSGRKVVGAIYKRTRKDEKGQKVQRAEVRFDDIAGCLRTPAGGSSRQLIIIVEGRKVRSRLISTRETARLMGLSDEYILPDKYNEAYHLTGDGVAVPVVRHIAEHILEPLLQYQTKKTRSAA